MVRMFDTKVWRRTRTDCLSYYCPQLPLVCFLKHHRSRTYVQGAFLLQHHAPHIFFKIGGNETNKSPPIIHFNLYIFHMLSPYPQCLIVLRVHCHNIYSSCRYGFPWTSCLVGIALYENPNIRLHFLKTSVEDFSTMAIRSTN